MRIFIDIGHPAHVHYFRNFIKIMQEKGHDFFISAREKDVTQLLLKAYDIPYYDRGKGSNSLVGKTSYLLKAVWILFLEARKFKPDVFLSFASPYAAHVSKLLGRPHISFTDTEHAKLGKMSFAPFTECIITPSSFNGDFGKKHVRFNGFMELCYLHPKYFTPNRGILDSLKLIDNEPFAFLRFVSWKASHDRGNSGIPDNIKVKIVRELKKKMRVFISSEGALPSELANLEIKVSVEKIHDVLGFSSLYLGEGATMASESAILGTPAVYVNSLDAGTLRELEDRYGLVMGFRNPENLIEKLTKLVVQPDLKTNIQIHRKRLLGDKIDVTAFMVWFVESYPESYKIMMENPKYQEKFR